MNPLYPVKSEGAVERALYESEKAMISTLRGCGAGLCDVLVYSLDVRSPEQGIIAGDYTTLSAC